MMSGLKKQVAANPEKFERIFSRIEIAGLLATVIAVALITNKTRGADIVLKAGLSTLAFVYAFLVHAAPEFFRLQSSRRFAFALQMGYLGLAITMMAILFALMNWTGSLVMMNAGCIITGIMFAFFTYKMYFGTLDDEAHRVIINNLVVRMLPALLVTAYLIAMYFRK